MNFIKLNVSALPVGLSSPSSEIYPCSLVQLSKALRKMVELTEREGAVETPTVYRYMQVDLI